MKKQSVLDISKETTIGSTNRKIFLDYTLILTDRRQNDIFENSDVYSILITQNEDGITTEYDFLYDVARDEKNAVAIMNLLVYNNVMPSNARDVLEDNI